MKDPKKLFHLISYLQYPFMLIALFYCYRPLLNNLDMIWADFNMGLVFLGIGISFSTLQDTTKTQNKLSLRIYQKPRLARIFLVVIGLQIILFFALGLAGLFTSADNPAGQLAFGFLSLAIGMVGMLKAAVEMAENHRLKDIE